MKTVFLPALALCIGLTGCYDPLEYWRRTGSPSTAYLTGQQSQALLEKDISQCTCGTDQLRSMITDDHQAAEYQRSSLDDPQPGDPRQFQVCMQARGWERVDPFFAPGQTEERLDHYESVPNHPLCNM